MGRLRLPRIALVVGLGGLLWSQPEEEPPQPVLATFKGTRLYNLHTPELPPAKHLEFRVAHRFGDMRQGYANFFGIDAGANVRLSFGYSVLPWAEVGLERTGLGKWWNGYAKLRLLTQKAPKGMPVSVTWVGMVFFTERTTPPRYTEWTGRLEYLHQLLIARKFSRRFSAMGGILWLHQNMALSPQALNDWFWAHTGVRLKLTPRLTLMAEGSFPLWRAALEDDPTKTPLPGYQIPWSAGFEVETGGHVFQIGLTNAAGLSENQALLTNAPLLRLGFNISRMFSFQGGPVYVPRE